MSIIKDPNNPDITIINTPQGDLKFNFALDDNGVRVENDAIKRLYSVDSEKRKGIEQALNETLNPPENTPQEVKALQEKFNETLVAAFKQYGKAMDIGDSPMLTRTFAGGAMTQEKDHPGHFALGLDLDEISASNYKGQDQKPHAMQPEDIIRHELFHFVDFHPMESALKETRAVWFVNQFQMAEGRSPRMSYFNIDETYNTGIAPTTTGYNQRLEGVKIPGQNNFPEPSPDNHGWHPNHRQKEAEVHSSNETQPNNSYASLQAHISTLPPHQQEPVLASINQRLTELNITHDDRGLSA